MSVALAPAVRRPRRLVIPAVRRTPRETLRATLPFFLREAGTPAAHGPVLLSFDGTGFLDDFLAAAADPAKLPKLLPWRDWAEPPRGVLNATGEALYPETLARDRPIAIERDPALDPNGDGVPPGTPPWLRKLYLPLHTRFTFVAFDAVCEAPGWPRVGRGRVLAAGVVVRRLRPDPARLRWEDWISADGKRGIWIELAEPLETAGDPEVLSSAAFSGLATEIRARLSLQDNAPLPAALDSAKLALLPPDAAQGRAAEHATLFGYLPVFSRAEQAPDLAESDPAKISLALKAKASATATALGARAGDIAARVTPALRDLMAETVRPAAGGSLDAAWNTIAVWTTGSLIGTRAQAEAALETVTQSFLREAWRTLQPASHDGNAIAGSVPAVHGWLDAAETSLRAVALGSGGIAAFGSAWLASTYANRSSAWRVILDARLRQGIAAMTGETPATAPAPLPAFNVAQRDLSLQRGAARSDAGLRAAAAAAAAPLARRLAAPADVRRGRRHRLARADAQPAAERRAAARLHGGRARAGDRGCLRPRGVARNRPAATLARARPPRAGERHGRRARLARAQRGARAGGGLRGFRGRRRRSGPGLRGGAGRGPHPARLGARRRRRHGRGHDGRAAALGARLWPRGARAAGAR
nr:hypothetical protein [Rubritepida sp.]